MELRFGLLVAMVVMAGIAGAAVGYSYGYIAGYEWGFEKASVASTGWQPSGEPLDLTKVDWTKVKELSPPAGLPVRRAP